MSTDTDFVSDLKISYYNVTMFLRLLFFCSSQVDRSKSDWANLLSNVLKSTNQKSASSNTAPDWRDAEADIPSDLSTNDEEEELLLVAVELTQKCFHNQDSNQPEGSNRNGLMKVWCDFVKSTCEGKDRDEAEEMRDKRITDYNLCHSKCRTTNTVQYFKCCQKHSKRRG